MARKKPPELSFQQHIAVFLVRVHDYGGLEPSPSDINITAQLREAGKIVGIELLDHIIFNLHRVL